LKILHIITDLNVGGAETLLKRLIEFDTVNSDDVVIISLSSLGVIGEILRNQGETVHALNMSSSLLGFCTALWQLRKLIRHYQPQIVQTWMYHADLLGGLAAYLAGQRNIVWNIRIAAVPKANKLTIAIMRVSALLSHWLPKKIVCVAEAAKQVHIGYGYDAKRMVVIHNGLDFANFTASTAQIAALRQYCRFAENDVVIGWVGRFHPDKGQENFVKAAAIVVVSHPQAKFLLVGRGCDADNAQLMAWLTECNLQQHFVLLGERSDIPACLAVMTIFCMPSSNEGFPNALAEAMAMGLPCVATTAGDAAVLAGETAVLVEAEDEHALARGLLEILALPAEQRQQIGRRAKKRVMDGFSIAHTGMRFKTLYQDILLETK
jgi:glycosyltransferase involved in cell wall biosynthesis